MSWVPVLIATTWLAGAGVLAALTRRDPRSWAHFAQALILGPWLLALELLGFSALGIPIALPYVLAPWWLLVPVLFFRLAALEQSAPAPRLGLALALGASAVALWATLGEPMVGGDPAENFGIFARIVAHTGQLDWARLQAGQVVGHLEYPPLLMLNEALYFQASGQLGAWAVKSFFAFQFLGLALLFVTQRGASAPLALVFLLQPDLGFFVTHGFAELPLVAAFAWLLVEAAALVATPNKLRAAGAFALAALVLALVKSEGVALALGACAVLLLHARRPGLALVVLLGTLLWPLILKLGGVEGSFLKALLADFSWSKLARFPAALGAFLSGVFGFERWPLRGAASLSWTTLLLLLFAIRRPATRRTASIFLACALAQLLVYSLVFALTPRDFAWHIRTAVDRLSVHFVPWILPAMWLACAPPQRTKIGDDQAASPDSVTSRT